MSENAPEVEDCRLHRKHPIYRKSGVFNSGCKSGKNGENFGKYRTTVVLVWYTGQQGCYLTGVLKSSCIYRIRYKGINVLATLVCIVPVEMNHSINHVIVVKCTGAGYQGMAGIFL